MKLMSFSRTWPQILARTKTVTRRVGMKIHPGERRQTVRKMRGLRKGQTVERGPVIRIVSVTEERLSDFVLRLDGRQELTKEGFPGKTVWYLADLLRSISRVGWDDPVLRIEFRYEI